jgi:hypothetical protein
MSRVINGASVYLIPGMQAKITAPKVFVAHGTQLVMDTAGNYTNQTLVNGFYLENTEVGSIRAVPGQPAVVYTHKKFSPNRIVFVAKTKETGIVDVISVPIHDHSSIVTGGPAYATYFADDEIGETEGNT